MRQPSPEAPTAPPHTARHVEPSPSRWRQGTWALGGSVLAHALVLQALTAPPDRGTAYAPAAAEQAKTLAAPLNARVAVVTPTRQAAPPPDLGPPAVPAPTAAERPDGAFAAAAATPAATGRNVSRLTADQPPTGPGPSSSTATQPAAASALPPLPLPQPFQAVTSVSPGSSASPAPPVSDSSAASPSAGAGPAPLKTLAAGLTARTAAAVDEDTPPPPVYATRTPPPFRLTYALKRGALSGQAELSLQRPGAGYELELKGTVLGMEVLGMSSRGSFGAPGLMPERFVDRRRGKDRLAANFDHAAGRITYSGTSAAQPLLPGAQDRLSWMVQLGAILEAAPARYPAGSRIALSVSGARGDVDTWTFIVQGRQRISLPGGTMAEALRLTREPRRPYDTQVETWLDPAQHHLPVRARLTVLPGGETLELSLQPS